MNERKMAAKRGGMKTLIKLLKTRKQNKSGYRRSNFPDEDGITRAPIEKKDIMIGNIRR